ncbi:CHAT domain protein [Ceratobasidium sp. AG-Ba]|nr:CHAT domain protein [Ceratobasidium sp. AG-Ba]QRW04485.1 CHAT domain protein [Ceratobasidium sp. AG-Ba]
MAAFLQIRFDRFGVLEDLNESIQYGTKAARMTPDDHPNKPTRLNTLWNSLQSRFHKLGEVADIQDAIEYQSQAVALIADGHPEKPGYLNNLGLSWQSRFHKLGELSSLDHAIEYLSKAVALTPAGDPDKPAWLSNLGLSWQGKYELVGEISALDQALEYQTQAVDLTPEDHPDKSEYLNKLGLSWRNRFKRFGELGDIGRAINYHTRAVNLTPDGHPSKPGRLNNLGVSWLGKFEHVGDLADLGRAIDFQTQAVELTPESSSGEADLLGNLGGSWLSRFERLGELEDLNRAIEYQSRAVYSTLDGHPEKPRRLDLLGGSWNSRFERFGELEAIENSVKFRSQAVELTPDGHPHKPRYMNNLGNLCHCQFKLLGELTYLHRALDYQSRVVDLTPDTHPNKPGYLSNLGNSWHSRFERLGELADLEHAIDCQSRAVALTPNGHPDKPGRLSNLGNAHQSRFERLGELADLDRAIDCQSQAVALSPDSHPRKSIFLNNLGNSLQSRFRRLDELEDIKLAIEYQSQAVALTPDGHPDKPGYLINVGALWRTRFERFEELSDLEYAIECQSKAVALTSDHHPEKLVLLNSLGISLLRRAQHMGDVSNLEEALMVFRTAATATAFKPSIQMQCARNWARASISLGRSPLAAYQAAFSLLPRLVWIGQTIQHRHETMTAIRDLASQAAAWAISVNLYDLALEWLEQGRSVVWGQTLQLRNPFNDLFLVDSRLAQKLRDIASRLDSAGSTLALQVSGEDVLRDVRLQTEHHNRLALEWEKLLEQARQIPGFESYMRPLKSKEIKQAAKDGPVVVINTHLTQCNAIIVMPMSQNIMNVPLDGVEQEKLDQISTKMHHSIGIYGGARGFTQSKSEGNIRLLMFIWSHVVEPILRALNYIDNPVLSERPHITWCTTGAMSFLPLHAAGLYDGHSLNTFDIVVSSYTPTLRALLFHKSPSSTQSGLLAVGQATSLGQAPLPKTVDELKTIGRYSSTILYHELEGASATVDATLAAMQTHSWVHLACHAVQDRSNPSKSAFYLHDGLLTLEEITRRQFKHKGLAFLSACQTATGDDSLPDEAAHLAAGMLIAGYPSIIATMWWIMDEDAPFIADIVYSELLKDGKMDHTQSARALHKAVKVLRERVGEKNFQRWAPFIHMGV